MKLKSLKIQSFVTSLDIESEQTIVGGLKGTGGMTLGSVCCDFTKGDCLLVPKDNVPMREW